MHFKAVTILLAMLAMSMSWPGAQAAKCSDHIMALKAGGLSNDDDGINSYGNDRTNLHHQHRARRFRIGI